MKLFEECLCNFLQGVKMTENVDYLDKKSIRKNNKGVDLYRKNAKYIADFYPNKISDFLTLLSNDNEKVKICCAICATEFMQINKEQKEFIKNIVVEHFNKSDAAEQMMWRVWIEEHMQSGND